MSLSLLNVGGTISGGTTVALTNAGSSTPKKVAFYTPSHTRLAAREVDFFVEQAKTTATDPGVARAGAKILFANRDAVEGCCTVQTGSVIVDLNFRWSLNQPDTLVDDAIKYAISVLGSAAFADAIKKGILPA